MVTLVFGAGIRLPGTILLLTSSKSDLNSIPPSLMRRRVRFTSSVNACLSVGTTLNTICPAGRKGPALSMVRCVSLKLATNSPARLGGKAVVLMLAVFAPSTTLYGVAGSAPASLVERVAVIVVPGLKLSSGITSRRVLFSPAFSIISYLVEAGAGVMGLPASSV